MGFIVITAYCRQLLGMHTKPLGKPAYLVPVPSQDKFAGLRLEGRPA